MATGFGDMELELELEGLGEFESEFESEFEAGMPEAFGLGDVTNWASNQWTALKTPGSWQRKALIGADKAILTGGGTALGASLGGPAGAVLGGALGTAASTLLPDSEFEFEGEGEFESEFESEFETELFANPVSRAYPDAMMEYLGQAAMESESEFEAAEHFLPLIPLAASKVLPVAARALPRVAAKVVPRVARVITHATPHLTHGVANLTRHLHRDPRTRHLVRAVPTVAKRAVATIAKHAAAGRPVSPHRAVRILAHHNHRVLGNPRIVRNVLHRSHAMDRRFHRMGGYPQLLGGVPGHAGLMAHHAMLRHTGVPAHLRHLHPLMHGGRARVCPTCGRPFTRGGRCCCCC